MKEFLEHLRKVHFALLTLSFVTIGFLLLPKESAVDKALRELELFESIVWNLKDPYSFLISDYDREMIVKLVQSMRLL